MRHPEGTVTTTARRVLLTLSVNRRAPACCRTSTGTPMPCTWSATVRALFLLPDCTVLSLLPKRLVENANDERDALHEDARYAGLANNCGRYSPDGCSPLGHVAPRRQAAAGRLTFRSAPHSAAKLNARPSNSCGRRLRRGMIAMCSSCAMVRSDAAQGSCARMNLAMRGA